MTNYSDMTIMANMFNIVNAVEDLSQEYNLKLPQLTLSNLMDIKYKLVRKSQTPDTVALLDALDLYEKLSLNLGIKI